MGKKKQPPAAGRKMPRKCSLVFRGYAIWAPDDRLPVALVLEDGLYAGMLEIVPRTADAEDAEHVLNEFWSTGVVQLEIARKSFTARIAKNQGRNTFCVHAADVLRALTREVVLEEDYLTKRRLKAQDECLAMSRLESQKQCLEMSHLDAQELRLAMSRLDAREQLLAQRSPSISPAENEGHDTAAEDEGHNATVENEGQTAVVEGERNDD